MDDLKQYLYNRYAKDGITPSKVDSILLMLRSISGTLYEANKAFISCCVMDLFSTVRTERRRIFILNLLISALPKTISSKWLISSVK